MSLWKWPRTASPPTSFARRRWATPRPTSCWRPTTCATSAPPIRWGAWWHPDEVAHTIAFVASQDSGFVAGHCVEVNGGLAID